MSEMPSAPGAAASDAAPYLWCSDCRTPLRDRYYALNERPLCAKCSPSYKRRIENTDGKGAMLRVGMQGALVALLGVAVLTGVILAFPTAKVLFVIPIGYFIGKRMMKALDGYSARRYQWLAVGLTYACFLAGFLIPAQMQEQSDRERHIANRARAKGTVATQNDQLREEMAKLVPASDAGRDVPDAAGRDTRGATRVESNVGGGLGLVMLLFFPFISMVQLGMMFSAAGVASLGFALYQAWNQTDGQGMTLELSGPFRVGQGPIRGR
jgi:hypothetical protein